jgi:glucuronate isomerase
MKPRAFIHEDFLLESEVARELYHVVAAKLPIIDYHCHLSPTQIANNHRFATITELWLNGDHYKWRAMRTNGVAETLCTGNASAWEKFEAWAKTVPSTLRNPLYHWTHMELAHPFGITDRLLDGASARDVYDRANAQLAGEAFTTQGLLRQFRVAVVCTTDDPADSLVDHAGYAQSSAGRKPGATRLYPTWRPDRALALEDLASWNAWIDRLENAADVDIMDYDAMWTALDKQHAFFHAHGCRSSDHGLETIYAEDYSDAEVAAVFAKARSRKAISYDELMQFKSALLYRFAVQDHARGWVQQYHLGALRNNNTRMLRALGPDSGFDSIGDFEHARPLARFLDRLDRTDQLAPTILYNLNPRDNEVMATMIGNFQDGMLPGKMQFGSAWWFLDQLDGMRKQLDALSNMGLLARFVGMLTDSRSFLSYSRHEYFRRLLCNMLGEDVQRGFLPDDRALLGRLVRDVCFANAKRYFPFGDPVAEGSEV